MTCCDNVPSVLYLNITAPVSGGCYSGETISVPCCTEPVPRTLYATFDFFGSCSCLQDEVYTLQYESESSPGVPCAGSGLYWNSCPTDKPAIGCLNCVDQYACMRISLICDNVTNPQPQPDCLNYRLIVSCPAGSGEGLGATYPTSCQCNSPFNLVFDGTFTSGSCCLTNVVQITITQ